MCIVECSCVKVVTKSINRLIYLFRVDSLFNVMIKKFNLLDISTENEI